MSRAFDSAKINVGTLFSQPYFFRIPIYQRAFSWTEDNFDDLIGDIMEADRTSEYFLGTIVLHATNDVGDHDVVDGQQRITSLALLLACLRDLVTDENFKASLQDKLVQRRNVVDGIPEKNRLEVKDGARFNPLVTKPGGTDAPVALAKETPSGSRYLEAVKTFKTRLSGLSQDRLESIVQFINQRCIVISLSAGNFEEAFRLFTIVNDRGKQLRRVDILKASNLDPAVVTDETVRDRLAHKWEDLENDVGDVAFESVFSHLRLILLKDKPQKDLSTEFNDRIFKKGLAKKGESFLEFAFDYINIYRRLFVDGDFIAKEDPGYAPFKSLLYVMNNEFTASEWRAPLLHFAKKFGAARIYDFLLALEKAYLTDWVKATRKDERFATYSKILESIDTLGDADAVIKSIAYDESAIRAAVRNKNLYGSSYAKYVLLRLELLASEMEKPHEFQARSIEHVLPQNPEENSAWLAEHNATAIDEYVNSVGNLVLLSRSRNSSAGRKEFEDKKKSYLAPRVSDFPRSVEVLSYAAWTRATIEERTEIAAKKFLDKP